MKTTKNNFYECPHKNEFMVNLTDLCMNNKKYVISYISNNKYPNKLFIIVGYAVDITKIKNQKWYHLYSFDKRQTLCIDSLISDYDKNEFPYIDGNDNTMQKKFKNFGGELIAECQLSNVTNDHSVMVDSLNMLTSYSNDLVSYKYIELSNLYVYPEFRNRGFANMFINNLFNNIIMRNCLVYVCAGASNKEYPEEPDIIRLCKIANDLAKFYEKIGFISINDICDFMSKHALLKYDEQSARILINYYKEMVYSN